MKRMNNTFKYIESLKYREMTLFNCYNPKTMNKYFN